MILRSSVCRLLVGKLDEVYVFNGSVVCIGQSFLTDDFQPQAVIMKIESSTTPKYRDLCSPYESR